MFGVNLQQSLIILPGRRAAVRLEMRATSEILIDEAEVGGAVLLRSLHQNSPGESAAFRQERNSTNKTHFPAEHPYSLFQG